MRFRLLLAAGLMAATSLCASASSLTYDFSRTISGVTAYGTITTDGTMGVLQTANLLDFTLTITNGATTEVAGPTRSFVFAGDSLSADANGLRFDFSGGYSGFSMTTTDNPFAYDALCFVSGGAGCQGGDTNMAEVTLNQVSYDTGVIAGSEQIAKVAPAMTPEPSSLVLLLTGVAGCSGIVRRRFQAV